MDTERERMVAGAMTGTSLDGIDVALVRVRGSGRAISATLIGHHAAPLDRLGEPLRRLAEQTPADARRIAGLAVELGELHADAIAGLAGRCDPPPPRLDLVAAHGQTVLHAPPLSWQLLDPAPIVRRLGCPVVCDLRAADLAAGGQGAPITPVADAVLFGDPVRGRAVVNLGGFANATILPAGVDDASWDRIRGFDVCACNHVLDAVARQALDAPCDRDGRAAASGAPDAPAAADLGRALAAQAAERRSLGTRDEARAWVSRHRATLAPADLAASAVAAVAQTIGRALAGHDADEIVLAGGGARNAALVAAIAAAAPAPVTVADACGIPVEAREAAAMAVLGALCADGVPITLPQVTGCPPPAPVAGRWSVPAGWTLAPPRGPAAATGATLP
jgi:1,6-anhydro-N-acetylmuramate kinase